MARGCDICAASGATHLYRQRFAAFDDRSAFEGYAVVACDQCGFVYAERIPGQDVFDRYYREMSKYESHDRGGDVSPVARDNYRAIVAEIAGRLPDRDLRILDVGSASGHLLAEFRAAGYRNVTGFDPSPRCTALARERYGIEVVNTPISAMRFAGAQFDLILLSSVLEHLRDLVPTVRELTTLLAPGGAIWFEVPDMSSFPRFVEAPFQQFSLEHINFFTEASLVNLLGRVGFAPAWTWTAPRKLGMMNDPGLDGIFRASDAATDIVRDAAGPEAIRAYIAASDRLETRLCERIAPLIERGRPVAVWGIGSLTLHMLANARFRGLRIAAFVDSNKNYQGKTIGGIPITAPEAMVQRDETIVIVSRVYEQQIADAIRTTYALSNEVFRLFDGAVTV